MKKKILVIILLVSCRQLPGFSLPSKSSSRADIVIPSIINNDFPKALATIDSIIKSDPQDPFPYILKLTAMGMRDIDFDKTIDSAEFLSTYRNAILFSDSLEKTTGKSSYTRMLSGFCKAMHAAFYLRNDSYIAAMQHGFDALNSLEESRKIDSTNTEALMFSGLYDFARAELRSKLWWVLFWYPGDRKAGIEKLRKCSINSTLSKTAAKLSLSEIYIKEKQTRQADSLLDELEVQFPASRFVMWSRVKFFESEKAYDSAAKMYELLAQSYKSIPEGRYNYLVTQYQAALMFRNSRQLNHAASLCQSILSEPDLNNYREIRRDTQRLLERVKSAESKS